MKNEIKTVNLEEEFNKSQEKEFEKDQIKNVYINTFYFTILSIVFGWMYYYICL